MRGSNIMFNSIRLVLIFALCSLSLNTQTMDNPEKKMLQTFSDSIAGKFAIFQTVGNAARTTYDSALWAYDNRKGIGATGCALTGAGIYGNYKLSEKTKQKIKAHLKCIGRNKLTTVAGCYVAYRLLADDEIKQLIIGGTNMILAELADIKEITQNGFNEILNQLDKARTEREELREGQRHIAQVSDQTNEMVRQLMEKQSVENPPEVPQRKSDSLDETKESQQRSTDVKVEPKKLEKKGGYIRSAWSWFTTPPEPTDLLVTANDLF